MATVVEVDKPTFLDISSRLGKVRKRVEKVGIELEGGWKKLPNGTSSLVPDTSVNFHEIPQTLMDPMTGKVVANPEWPKHTGELNSPPIVISEFPNWLKQHYPSHVNHTCGMHVHMSFDNQLKYQRLMDERYPLTVVEFFTRWAKQHLPANHYIWPRLRGKSDYCQHKFFPDYQAQNSRKDHDRAAAQHRYTVINFSFSRTRTIECRLLPMMPTIDLAISAINCLIDITSAFLFLTGVQRGKRGEETLSEGWKNGDRENSEEIIVTI